ncbi:MAG: hypothetical protein F6K10_30635 [Moorea sp. SIO2B7]|nr:hypothetical protein [Moorena sp. SIO2B7]
MVNSTKTTTNFYSIPTENQAFQKIDVSSSAAVWECKETRAKSLHATIKFLPGDLVIPFEL